MSLCRAGRSRAVLSVIVVCVCAPVLLAQSRRDVAELRGRLREHYQILALQDGIGLVPRQQTNIRIIEIHGGAVRVDGRELTGRELRDRLGADADLIVRASYLDPADQRTLAQAEPGTPSPAPRAEPPAPSEPGEPTTPPSPPSPETPARNRHRGDVVRVGGNVRVGPDDFVNGDVAAIAGSATVDGEVTGDVAVVMGSLTLGPQAYVHGDVSVVGGTLNRDPKARVGGQVSNVGIGPVPIGPWALPATVLAPFAWRVGTLAATLVRVAVITILALIALALGRTWVERIADHAAIDPWRAGLIGFFAEILSLPVLVITIVVLAVSIIGIPLLVLVPFALLFLGVVLLVGFTGVAYQVGRVINARAGWNDHSPYMTVVVGVIIIAALTVLARSAAVFGGGLIGFPLAALGYVVEYLAWTIGFGSAIQVWLRRRRGITPPPLPA